MALRVSDDAADYAGDALDVPSRSVLGMRVDATSYARATETVLRWARHGEARYVCVATVHMVMEAHDHPEFQQLVNAADLVTPDGMPLVWALRLLGVREASRVYGPDLTPLICAAAARAGVPVGFYGGSRDALDRMIATLSRQFPGLRVAYHHSPPFRPLDEAERAAEVQAIRTSGAKILFVGLGCPKQERWMAEHRDQLDCVMLGVGAAFDFLSGQKAMAPDWIQSLGLEWAFRLACEPRRLWKRYLYHNPRYLVLLARQLAGGRPSFDAHQ
jgi:N-acetylglucosaminyldiphosphoundecaprenol N-acetyl-beta-D-mannosaminyltransferase